MTRPDRVTVATATRCTCGEAITVSHYVGASGLGTYSAVCPRCYDPSEGGRDTERVCGHGATLDEALWAWADEHETVHEIEWVPEPMWPALEQQINAEAARQRGLGLTVQAPATAVTLH